jgi:two-component system nitrate/nitrite sensor histidine kinase NarX
MDHSRNRPSPEEKTGQYRSIFDAATDGLIITDSETGLVLEANPAACALHGYTREEFIGLLPAAFIHPDSQHIFRNYVRAFRSGAVVDTRVRHVRRDGSTFHAEWRGTEFTYQGRPCLLAVVRDVSRHLQADQRLHQRVKSRTREQSALLAISHALASTLELQPDLILEQLQGIIEYTRAGLFELTDSTLTALAVRVSPGLSTGRGPQQLELAAPFQVHVEGPETLAALFNGHRPIRIADVRSADPAAEFLRSLLNRDAAVLLEGVRAWMWVPMAVKGRIIGGLGVAHTRRNYFTAHHAALALSMADQVAITMVNAELNEHARALAALQERQRLAQNLHDAVNQSLFSAGLIAEVLPRLWDRDPVEARQSLEDLRRLTRGAQAEMRELLAELRPSVLADSSLSDLLRQLANAFTGRTNVPASVTTAAEHVLSADIQVALYRICQEALNNVAKHAAASRVEIDLYLDTGAAQVSSSLAPAGAPQEIVVSSVELRIRDDGHGFDPAQPATSGHFGLGMMRERAEAVGARLTVTSLPGHGTEITVRWQKAPEQEAR